MSQTPNKNKAPQDDLEAVYPLVVALLREDAKYRDSDNLIVHRIHRDELLKKRVDVRQFSVFNYWELVNNKTLTNRDSITRARRKAQELLPDTRGLKWKKRQANQTDFIEKLGEIEQQPDPANPGKKGPGFTP
jgi:hypothetical protein